MGAKTPCKIKKESPNPAPGKYSGAGFFVGENMKRCPVCKADKDENGFGRDRSRKSGRRVWCRSCDKSRRKKYEDERCRKDLEYAGRRRRRHLDPRRKEACRRSYERRKLGVTSEMLRNMRPVVSEYPKQRLKWEYDLSIEEYERMLKAQDGKCAICRKDRPLHVDHDHKTGKVRGLLCSPCNRGLGHFEDCVENLESAAEYLKKAALLPS